jgi:hypothetical protein
MMRNPVPHWQRRRSRFNHDWLKNRFLPALTKWANILAGEVEDPAFDKSFPERILPEWESQREEALAICETFEDEMSSRRILDRPPLSRCDESTRRWLGTMVHQLWLARYPVNEWVARGTAGVQAATAAYARVQEGTLRLGGTALSQSREHRERFADFQRRCQELAATMHAFPSEIKVV